MPESLLDYGAPQVDTSTESLADYGNPIVSNKKPKGLLERTREMLSPITGPTQQQLEENPPPTLPENATYGQKFSNAQGLLPKLFTSPFEAQTVPEQQLPSGIKPDLIDYLDQIGRGIYNVGAKGIAEPLASLGGLATAGMGVAAKAGSGIANFGGKLLGGVLAPQAAGTLAEASSAPTLQQKVEKLLGGGLLGLGAYGGLRGVTPEALPQAKAPVEIIPKARQLPENTELPSSGQVYEMPPSSIRPTLALPAPVEPKGLLEDRNFNKELPPSSIQGETLADYSLPAVVPKVEEPTPAPVKFIGRLEATHKTPVRDLYNLTEDVPGLGKKGNTVTGDSIVNAGLELPKKPIELPDKTTSIETPKEGETLNVTQSESINRPEYKGVPTGTNIPENSKEVRQEESTVPSNSSSGERSGEQLSKSEAGPVEGGLNIKINPNTGELGGIDLSAVMDFAKNTYENIKDFGKWSVEMLKKFPELGNHIRVIWNRLKAGQLDAPGMTSAVTHLTHSGPLGVDLAESSNKAYDLTRENRGKYIEVPNIELHDLLPYKSPKDVLANNTESAKRVLEHMYQMDDTGKSNITLTPEEQRAVKVVQKINTGVRNDVNARIAANPGSTLHGGGINVDYIYKGFDRGVLDTITNKAESPKAQQYKQDFIDYRTNQKGQTSAEAIKDWNTIKKGFSKQSSDTAEQFGPLDKATGLGIPRSMRSNNLFDVVKNYGERVSRRLAFHDAIETNPKAQAALGELSANKYWKAIYRELSGQREQNELVWSALGGLAKSGMTGTLTGIVNSINSQYMGFPQYTWKQIATTTLKQGREFNKNLERSFRQGSNRENIASFEFGEGGLNDIIRTTNRTRDIFNSSQGKNLLERSSRVLNFSAGRVNTIENFEAMLKGVANKTQKRWLDTYGKDENLSQYIKQGHLPDEVADRMSARYVESVQGSYNLKTLPIYTQEGWTAPLLSLSRWSIDRSNRFMHDVVTPLANGDIQPALKATLGVYLGSQAVDEIRKMVTKRRNPVPTVKEILAGADQGADIKGMMFYKLASLVSLSSVAGMYGDIVKTLGDMWHGNRAQDINNPGLELVKNTATRVFDIFQAHAQGELDANDIPDVISKILEDNIQTYRVWLANMSKEKQEEIDRSNAFKERRVFRQVTGRPVQTLGGEDTSNPFLNKDIREYKRTPDINRAVELMPRIGAAIVAKSPNDPEQMMRSFRGLKENSYQTFPEITKDPLEFGQYLKYLQATKGPQETQRLLTDYMKQKTINEAKSKFIP